MSSTIYLADTNLWIRAACHQASDGAPLSGLDRDNGGTGNGYSPREARAYLLDLFARKQLVTVPAVRAEVASVQAKAEFDHRLSDYNKSNLSAYVRQTASILAVSGTEVSRIGSGALTRESIIASIEARKAMLAIPATTPALRALWAKLTRPACNTWFDNLLRRFDFAVQKGAKDIPHWPDFIIASDAQRLGLTLATLDFEAYVLATRVIGANAVLLQ